MPKYRVVMQEIYSKTFHYEIEADSHAEAETQAENYFDAFDTSHLVFESEIEATGSPGEILISQELEEV